MSATALPKVIGAVAWLARANERCPKLPFVTEWMPGTVAPVRVGFYERHFIDSPGIGIASVQYWDGEVWRITIGGPAHWRQVGEYPAWRGLTEDKAEMQAPFVAIEAAYADADGETS